MIQGVYEQHHLLDLPMGPISVYESGDKNYPPVILLHGAMYDEARLIWYHLAQHLSKFRRVIAIDFPRHGGSRPWTGTVDQNCLNQILEEVIHEFALPPLPLIGLSMGGGVAIGFTLKNPDRVTGLVLMGPGGLGDKMPYQFLSWAFTKVPGTLVTRYYSKLSPEKMRKTMASLFAEGENTRNFDNLIALFAEEAQRKWKYRENSLDDWQLELMAPFKLKINFIPELHRLTQPVLWIRGENDHLISQRDMEEAVKRTPKGKLIVIENAGHLLPLEQPDEVNKAVEDFFNLDMNCRTISFYKAIKTTNL